MPTYKKMSEILPVGPEGSTIELTDKFGEIEVCNWGSERLSFRNDGGDPTVDGAESYHLAPGQCLVVVSHPHPDVIKAIASAPTEWSAGGVPR